MTGPAACGEPVATRSKRCSEPDVAGGHRRHAGWSERSFRCAAGGRAASRIAVGDEAHHSPVSTQPNACRGADEHLQGNGVEGIERAATSFRHARDAGVRTWGRGRRQSRRVRRVPPAGAEPGCFCIMWSVGGHVRGKWARGEAGIRGLGSENWAAKSGLPKVGCQKWAAKSGLPELVCQNWAQRPAVPGRLAGHVWGRWATSPMERGQSSSTKPLTTLSLLGASKDALEAKRLSVHDRRGRSQRGFPGLLAR